MQPIGKYVVLLPNPSSILLIGHLGPVVTSWLQCAMSGVSANALWMLDFSMSMSHVKRSPQLGSRGNKGAVLTPSSTRQP
jgi:hypothetical protein